MLALLAVLTGCSLMEVQRGGGIPPTSKNTCNGIECIYIYPAQTVWLEYKKADMYRCIDGRMYLNRWGQFRARAWCGR